MSGFVDRRLADKKMAIDEMDQMDRQISQYAEQFGLAGIHVPKVIGASDQNAWVETKYLVAWGSELEAWQKQTPHNFTAHYPSKANPHHLGGLLERELMEGRRINEEDLRRIALTIGRARELKAAGLSEGDNPLWSYAASTFAKAVILDELKTKGRLDLRNPKLNVTGPVIGLSFKSSWTEHLDSIESGSLSVTGTITVPRTVRTSIEQMKGQPLSRLIAGASYDNITIQNIHIEPDWMDDESNEITLTIYMDAEIERLGKAPEGIKQEFPVKQWLEMAQG